MAISSLARTNLLSDYQIDSENDPKAPVSRVRSCTTFSFPLFATPQGNICSFLVVADFLAGFSNGSGLFSSDCMFPGELGIPNSILSIALSMLIPKLLVLGTCGFWTIRTGLKHAGWKYWVQRCVLSVLVIIYLAWWDTWNRFFRVFHCAEVDKQGGPYAVANSRYWLEDTDVDCFKKEHLYLAVGMGAPTFVGLTISWGFMMGFLVLRVRRYQNNGWNMSMFGPFYKGYRANRWYWEMVVMLRKLILAGIIVVSYDNAYGSEKELASFAAIVLLAVALVAQVLAAPYDSSAPSLNHLEVASLGASMMVFLSGLSFNHNELVGVGRIAFSVIAFCAVAATLGTLVFRLAREALASSGKEIDFRWWWSRLRRR